MSMSAEATIRSVQGARMFYLRARWTMEADQDLQFMHGVRSNRRYSIAEELMLEEQFGPEMAAEIMGYEYEPGCHHNWKKEGF